MVPLCHICVVFALDSPLKARYTPAAPQGVCGKKVFEKIAIGIQPDLDWRWDFFAVFSGN